MDSDGTIMFPEVDMQDEGAWEIFDADHGDLSNDIHPALDLRMFKHVSHTDYALISTSLRLVSRFLTEPSLLPFWCALILGERRRLSRELEAKYGQPMYSFHCMRGGMAAEDVRRTLDALTSLTKCVKYQFISMDDDLQWGLTDPDYQLPGLKKGIGEGASMYLNIQFLIVLRRLDISISQRLRVQYYLAISILHELAHVVRIATTEIPRDAHYVDIVPAMEPFFEDDRQAECGYACTQVLVNGSVEPYFGWPDCRFGLTIAKWPSVWSRSESGADGFLVPERRRPKKFTTTYVISMEHIQPLFTDQFWEYDVKRYGAREVRIEGRKKRLGYRFPAECEYDSDHDGILSNDSSNESWRTPADGIRGRIKRP
ncbi:MAG: hypothetical protein M1836_005759 [Candelina mexicana]|nr:MAG: hypothetical protein M1836_005759 [Candelina mexicana]